MTTTTIFYRFYPTISQPIALPYQPAITAAHLKYRVFTEVNKVAQLAYIIESVTHYTVEEGTFGFLKSSAGKRWEGGPDSHTRHADILVGQKPQQLQSRG